MGPRTASGWIVVVVVVLELEFVGEDIVFLSVWDPQLCRVRRGSG